MLESVSGAVFQPRRIPTVMKSPFYFLITAVVAACIFPIAAFAQSNSSVRHVASKVPVQGLSREMSAERATPPGSRQTSSVVSPKANPWKLQATLPGAVIHDISFPTAKIGYAAAEAGQVWKTSDGGAHWTEVLNLSYPWYWYGVHAFNAKDVIISGFYDSSTFEGIIRWSHVSPVGINPGADGILTALEGLTKGASA